MTFFAQNAPKASGKGKSQSQYSRIIIGGVIAYAVISAAILIANDYAPRLRFDPAPLINSSVPVQVHASSAILTLLIGTVIMLAPKGLTLHRTLGWIWVASMAVTAISSFFITVIFQNFFSPIHALSAWTLIGLPMGIAAIRRKDVAQHRKTMTEMFVGGMLIAGLFTFLPGRMMWSIFFA